MDKLFNDFQQNTEKNLQNRIDRENESKKTNDKLILDVITNLFNHIIENSLEIMRQSSMDGYYSCSLYEYTHTDIFEQYPTIFLVKGPKQCVSFNSIFNYFDNKGIKPLLLQLQEYFYPFKCFIRYNRSTSKYNIIVSWKPN